MNTSQFIVSTIVGLGGLLCFRLGSLGVSNLQGINSSRTLFLDEVGQSLQASLSLVTDWLRAVSRVQEDGWVSGDLDTRNIVSGVIDLGNNNLLVGVGVVLVQSSQLLVSWSKSLTVAAPWSVVFHQNVLLLLHNLVVFVSDQVVDSLVLDLWDRLALDDRKSLTGLELLDKLRNVGVIQSLVLGDTVLEVALEVVDDKQWELFLHVQVLGVHSVLLSLQTNKIDLASKLLGELDDGIGNGLFLALVVPEEVGQWELGLHVRLESGSADLAKQRLGLDANEALQGGFIDGVALEQGSVFSLLARSEHNVRRSGLLAGVLLNVLWVGGRDKRELVSELVGQRSIWASLMSFSTSLSAAALNFGPRLLQWPHHGAKNSARTSGFSLMKDPKVSAVNLTTAESGDAIAASSAPPLATANIANTEVKIETLMNFMVSDVKNKLVKPVRYVSKLFAWQNTHVNARKISVAKPADQASSDSVDTAIQSILQDTLPGLSRDINSIKNDQLLLVIIQYLTGLGGPFSEIASQLSQLTHLRVTNTHLTQFTDILKNTEVDLDSPESVKLIDRNLEHLVDNAAQLAIVQEDVHIVIKKTLFLESLILKRDNNRALRTLRTLTADYPKNEKVASLSKKLSTLLVNFAEQLELVDFTTKSMLEEQGWQIGGNFETSRETLVSEVLALLPADKVVPPNRLAELITQALSYQQMNDPYFIPTGASNQSLTLLKDTNSSTKGQFPKNLKARLEYHDNECWFVKYSNTGKYMATASVDKSIVIYDTQTYRLSKHLVGHGNTIIYLSWSQDDTKLITSSFDQTVKIWDIESGSCISTISDHDLFNSNVRIRSVEFFQNSDNFIIGSPDKKLCIFNIDGTLVHDFNISHRVEDLALVNDEKLLVVTHSCHLIVYDLTMSKFEVSSIVNIGKQLTSITVTPDDPDHCLINVKSDELQLWNVSNLSKPYLVNKYYGLQQSDYIIRGCVTNKNLVLSGSEDGLIYVWNKKFGNLIDCLKGHKSLVNCIDWKRTDNDEYEWASCGDDGVVNIWGIGTAATSKRKSTQKHLRISCVLSMISPTKSGPTIEEPLSVMLNNAKKTDSWPFGISIEYKLLEIVATPPSENPYQMARKYISVAWWSPRDWMKKPMIPYRGITEAQTIMSTMVCFRLSLKYGWITLGSSTEPPMAEIMVRIPICDSWSVVICRSDFAKRIAVELIVVSESETTNHPTRNAVMSLSCDAALAADSNVLYP
ncbi:hypothetical protein OGAPHI_005379 [Ogataea philodendri]|uniref:Uncharacterized protein n=1 Tax=Ogataea philodendri TaxID=1378263 RepID=A0A9P8P2B0_9ASCO|nr:uncharacterized protein OGAPHI_005379 [Ogataea philodendri]KAH3663389.1 hypothetical protein OGAPHI_005379 [Ogataea philodendri]